MRNFIFLLVASIIANGMASSTPPSVSRSRVRHQVPALPDTGSDALSEDPTYIKIPINPPKNQLNETVTAMKHELRTLNAAHTRFNKTFDKTKNDLFVKLDRTTTRIMENSTKNNDIMWKRMNETLLEERMRLDNLSTSVSAQGARLGALEEQSRQSSQRLEARLEETNRDMCRSGNATVTLRAHHERYLDDTKERHLELMSAIKNLQSRFEGPTAGNSAATKTSKDEDIKRNVDVRVEIANDERPGFGKLVTLTPMLAARKLRHIWNAQMGKGMVSVCYHNQPNPMTEQHPLADNDDPDTRKIFNGTMDAAHNPRSGIDLDVPTYINSLLMEVRNLGRDYVSLCLQDPAHDAEFYRSALCMNLAIYRKSKN